jgi:hypothetical protein
MLDSPTNLNKPKLRSYFDMDANVEYVNLGPYLDSSFQEYQYYVTENELHTLKKKEKNQLGTHFILNQILIICKMSKRKKCFYYEVNDEYTVEKLLVERIFKVLPSKIIYDDVSFEEFIIEQREYQAYTPIDTSMISWKKFKQFLKKNNLTMIEKKFTHDINVKLSLLH